jgi:hypothetical protein
MQTRAHRPARPAVGSTTGPGLLQRKCSCGGRCASCSKRRLDRKAVVRTSDLPVASRIVHEVLTSPGRPLGERLRRELEPRFGHDFSGVRVHDDARADASCRAVGAAAYTVGEHIAFAEGRFRPESREGRRLLGHELAHVVQQDVAAVAGAADDLAIMPPDAAQEREADRIAERVLQGAPIGRLTARSPRRQLQRADGKTFSCGVEVTDLVKGAVKDAKHAFNGWDDDEQEEACGALIDLRTGDMAWDIYELHEQKTHDLLNKSFRPPCATSGATPACGASVTVDGGCHFAGSANYVIFGVMCRKCSDFYLDALDRMGYQGLVRQLDVIRFRVGVAEFSESGMLSTIDLYKKWLPRLKGDSVVANIDAAKAWAKAGYNGWPRVPSPAPDRSNCVTDCPNTAAYKTFRLCWHPHLPCWARRSGLRPD